MAINKYPATYVTRVVLSELFRSLSSCRLVALRTLPVEFFVVFFSKIVEHLKVNTHYRETLNIAYETIYRGTNRKPCFESWADETITILEPVLDNYNIENKFIIVTAYKKFLMSSTLCIRSMYYVAKLFS